MAPLNRVLLLLGLLTTIGCTTEVDTTEPVEDNPVVLDLAGHWNSQCVDTEYGSLHLRFSVQGNYLTYTETYFNDSECFPSHEYLQVHHTFTANGAAHLEEPQGAKTLDLKLQWVTAKTQQTGLLNEWNSSINCGVDDWTTNQLSYVTGESCVWPHETVQYPDLGTVMMDIYKLEGSPASLKIGNQPNSDLRPTQFDERLVFFRTD